jgi:hypothetical protein
MRISISRDFFFWGGRGGGGEFLVAYNGKFSCACLLSVIHPYILLFNIFDDVLCDIFVQYLVFLSLAPFFLII